MEDDDNDYSDSSDDTYGNNYLRQLSARLVAETISNMNDDGSDNDSDDLSFVMYDDFDDDVDIEEIEIDQDNSDVDDDMSASDDDALSEASTVVNQDQNQSNDASPSGTDTEVENDLPAEEPIVQVQKKIKLDVPAEQPAPAILDDSVDEDQRCPICLEVWSNAGEHRLCSLRCGHLFGLKCIEQWFNIAQNATARKCPECNTKASKKDIRILYAKNLICMDTSEIEKLKEEIKLVTSQKDLAEKELKQYKSKEALYEQQLSSLRKKIQDLENTVRMITSERNNCNIQYDSVILKMNKVFDICNTGSCRVMAYNPWHKILVTSSGNAISRIFMETLSASVNSKIHNAPIRDIAFQEQHPNMLLSVGFDKKVILTDIKSNILMHSYQGETNLWSCCWSNYSNQTFFVGDARGIVTEYDIRYLQSGISTKENNTDRSPVVSLASVPTTSLALRAGGYLACQLNSCCAYSFKEGNYVGNQIDVEGPFTSLRYNERDNHLLLSCRASAKNPSVRHIVCTVEKNEDKIYFNKVHSFNAGSTQKLLSRPCYMNLQNDTVVVANNESLNNIVAWSIATGQQTYSLPISEPVVDVCSFENDAIYQAILTSKKLHLYNFKDISA